MLDKRSFPRAIPAENFIHAIRKWKVGLWRPREATNLIKLVDWPFKWYTN